MEAVTELEEAATLLVRLAGQAASDICSGGDEHAFEPVFYEFLYFFLHVTDRFAVPFGVAIAPRAEMMRRLAPATIRIAIAALTPSLGEEEAGRQAEERLDKADTEQQLYSLLPVQGNPAAPAIFDGTIFWRLGEQVAGALGNRFNPMSIVQALGAAVRLLPQLRTGTDDLYRRWS